jgi:hypothetical protein
MGSWISKEEKKEEEEEVCIKQVSYVIFGPAIGNVEFGVIDDPAKQCMDHYRALMGFEKGAKLQFTLIPHHGTVLASESAFFDFPMPLNEWAPPMRGPFMIFPTDVACGEQVMKVLAAKKERVARFMEYPSLPVFDLGNSSNDMAYAAISSMKDKIKHHKKDVTRMGLTEMRACFTAPGPRADDSPLPSPPPLLNPNPSPENNI